MAIDLSSGTPRGGNGVCFFMCRVLVHRIPSSSFAPLFCEYPVPVFVGKRGDQRENWDFLYGKVVEFS